MDIPSSELDLARPNALPFSGAAVIDWESSRAEASFQKRPILLDA
jgi:hypothetical protein